jgi:hypothetical protein
MPMLTILPLALFGASVAQAETIIVRSIGPSAKTYTPGKSLPNNAKLALQAGDVVTILDSRGTRVLKGPGAFAVSGASSAATSSTFSQFLKNTGARQARTGATRGTIKPAKSPNVWYIDVSKSGNMCVASPMQVTLWRSKPFKVQTVTLTSASDNRTTTVKFPDDQSVLAWPVKELPITNGGQYRLSGTGQSAPATITIYTMDSSAPNLETTASALIKRGCEAQIDLLVETAAVASE